MSNTLYAVIVATIAIATALLAVFDVVPATVAQMVPLLVVPFAISRGRRGCAGRAC